MPTSVVILVSETLCDVAHVTAATLRPILRALCNHSSIAFGRASTDSLCALDTENLNQWYQAGDQAYIIIASAMVLVMVPGLGFLYSGLARRKSALSLIWACMGSVSVVTFQWYFWGYSLAFSSYAENGFIGDLQKFGLMKTLGAPSPGSPLIPELLYAFYQVWRPILDTEGCANVCGRCNSAPSPLLSSSAVSLNAAVLSP
jgi:hypothetical protein